MQNKVDSNFYSNVHRWLNKKYGKADRCENPDCKGKSSNFEYALIKGKEYEYNRDNYKTLCVPCHRSYDTSEETRRRLSEVQKGKKIPPEVIAKRTASVLGSKRSEETRRKMSEAQKGKRHSEQTRKLMSEQRSGRNLSEVTRKKIGNAHKGQKRAASQKENIAKAKRAQSPLNDMQVRIIKKLKGELTLKYTGLIFGVSLNTIWRIQNGESWQ